MAPIRLNKNTSKPQHGKQTTCQNYRNKTKNTLLSRVCGPRLALTWAASWPEQGPRGLREAVPKRAPKRDPKWDSKCDKNDVKNGCTDGMAWPKRAATSGQQKGQEPKSALRWHKRAQETPKEGRKRTQGGAKQAQIELKERNSTRDPQEDSKTAPKGCQASQQRDQEAYIVSKERPRVIQRLAESAPVFCK